MKIIMPVVVLLLVIFRKPIDKLTEKYPSWNEFVDKAIKKKR